MQVFLGNNIDFNICSMSTKTGQESLNADSQLKIV